MRALSLLPLTAAALAFGLVGATAQQVVPLNDYPTDARADYVFVCMATNGQTRDALERCSCSIDVIASILPYEKYVDAETVLRMRQVSGDRVGAMRNSASSNDFVRDLRRAEAEGDIRCF